MKELKIGSVAPVWIPDDRVSMCMLCSAEFKLAFRRHHCRACGKVCAFQPYNCSVVVSSRRSYVVAMSLRLLPSTTNGSLDRD